MNVYYLPTRALDVPDIVTPPTRWSILRARGHRAWCRMRLVATDVWAALRRGGRPSIDQHIWLPEEPVFAPRPRALGPARILHLDDARRRRQLAV